MLLCANLHDREGRDELGFDRRSTELKVAWKEGSDRRSTLNLEWRERGFDRRGTLNLEWRENLMSEWRVEKILCYFVRMKVQFVLRIDCRLCKVRGTGVELKRRQFNWRQTGKKKQRMPWNMN